MNPASNSCLYWKKEKKKYLPNKFKKNTRKKYNKKIENPKKTAWLCFCQPWYPHVLFRKYFSRWISGLWAGRGLHGSQRNKQKFRSVPVFLKWEYWKVFISRLLTLKQHEMHVCYRIFFTFENQTGNPYILYLVLFLKLILNTVCIVGISVVHIKTGVRCLSVYVTDSLP